MIDSLKYRGMKDRIFFYAVCGITAIALIPLISIVWELVQKGMKQINIAFFTEVAPSTLDAMLAKTSGESITGGIANGIVGTLIMVGLASLIAIPVGLMAGIQLAEYKESKFSSLVRFVSELLNGIPSIVIGMIAYAWIVKPVTHGYSALAGSFALAIMMLPLIIRSTEESIKMLPSSLKEASLALGASYTSTIIRIIIPSALSGLLTGILLSISRVMGETAPLILTALGSSMISTDISKPSSAIPLLIWEFYNDPYLIDMIWSSSLFLLMIILVFNITAKRISRKWSIQ
jgi:phosphate transport system permease protein